ncbi:hypothetical protein ACJW30_02G149900 [Castanea mollissima]
MNIRLSFTKGLDKTHVLLRDMIPFITTNFITMFHNLTLQPVPFDHTISEQFQFSFPHFQLHTSRRNPFVNSEAQTKTEETWPTVTEWPCLVLKSLQASPWP